MRVSLRTLSIPIRTEVFALADDSKRMKRKFNLYQIKIVMSRKTLSNTLFATLFILLGLFIHIFYVGLDKYTLETMLYVEVLLLINVIMLALTLGKQK